MRLKTIGLAAGLMFASTGLVSAQDIQAESYQLDGVQITVIGHPFLAEDELMTLRLVGQNRDALELFVPDGPGYAALAIAPEEGFVRNGVPVDSAIAISGLQDIDTARASALEACDAARQTAQNCVIALEVAPR
jgi:hypothetical protein